jgi:hypothetical protein
MLKTTHPPCVNNIHNTNQLFKKTETMEQLEINIHLKYVTLKGDLIIPEGDRNCFLPWKW